MVLCEAADIVAGEGRVVFVIEGYEINSVEAGHSSFGRYPDIAVTGLKNSVNTILRKAVLCGPGLMA